MKSIFAPAFAALCALTLLTGCDESIHFPTARSAPAVTAPTTPSYCLAQGKALVQKGDLPSAYYWFWRGAKAAAPKTDFDTSIPSHPLIPEPEETSRFLCILNYEDTSAKLCASGTVVSPDTSWNWNGGVAIETVASFFPNGKGTYGGYTAEQAIGFVTQARQFCHQAVEQFMSDRASRSAEFNHTLENISAALPPAQ